MKTITKTSLFAIAAVLVVSMAVASVVLPSAFASRNSGTSNTAGDTGGNGNSGGFNVGQLNNGSPSSNYSNGYSGKVNILQLNNGNSGVGCGGFGNRC